MPSERTRSRRARAEPIRPEVARFLKSKAMREASPAVRRWFRDLLVEGERFGGTIEPAPPATKGARR